MAAGLLIVPLMTRVHATPWWEWAGLAAGLAAGAALGVIIGRWQRG
jgi:hypothetical protein